jgi:nitric oxide synthase oxygenase domain/subunit
MQCATLVLCRRRPCCPCCRCCCLMLQIRFACYTMPDGSQMGDRANGELTKTMIEFGWSLPEPRGEFDVLPIVIEAPGQGARVSVSNSGKGAT